MVNSHLLLQRIIGRRSVLEWLALSTFAAVLIWQLFVPPIIGLANNADFGKVLGIYSLGWPVEDEYKFVDLKYTFDASRHAWLGFISSEHVLAGIAILLNAPLSRDGTFDLRVIGALHASLFLLAFYLLQPLVRSRRFAYQAVLYVLLIAIFGDVLYVSWMNSFYQDAATLLFLLLTIVFYLRAKTWLQRGDQIGFVVAAILFAGSKSQHCLLAIFAAAALLFGGAALGTRKFRVRSAVVILGVMMVTWFMAPPDYALLGRYDVIFKELLPYSRNTAVDLEELGLNGHYARCIGTNAYEPGSPFKNKAFQAGFADRTSLLRLAWFLARRPELAGRAVLRALDLAGPQRPGLGNFTRSAGAGEYTETQTFATWSSLKKWMLAERGVAYLILFLGSCGALCAGVFRRHREFFQGAGCLCLMGLQAMMITTFGDALEVTRHSFVFIALADIVLVAALASYLPAGGALRS